ncbi:MAG TPA: squalene synthase HpnC [Vicinamibacterales bacterium]|nr:squalene synthase HpnC [Vicinamibacterales bacterium]
MRSAAAVTAGHYENFPVASILLPSSMRQHIAAVYAFARTADDFADEGQLTPVERLRLLDGWHRRLRHAAAGAASGDPPVAGEPPGVVDLFLALGRSIREKALPVELFEQLLSAFRQDVEVTRYSTWPQLLAYCERSANPVGRLVLRIADQRDARLDEWSDSICTALQLTNFWQDLKIDCDRGRIYVPSEITNAHGASERDLFEGRITSAWQAALRDVVARTCELFRRGRPLCQAVGGRLGYELRATWLGGMRILDRLEANRFDVIGNRPVLRPIDAPWFLRRMMTWSRDSRDSGGGDGLERRSLSRPPADVFRR